MEKTSSITKFDINNKTLYVKLLWQPNENDLFNIIIYDGETPWTGRFSYEFARKYKDRFEETEEQYFDNVKKALSKDSKYSYEFTLQPEDSKSATFSWKKKLEDSLDELAVSVHGSVPIHRDEAKQSKDFILDFLLAENRDLRNAIEAVNVRNMELTTDLDKCKNDLDKFVDIKTSLETTLYGKFVQLLNAKKKRTQLLEKVKNDASKPNLQNIAKDFD